MCPVVLTREKQTTQHSQRYVEETFGGALSKFITSFFDGRRLTPEQAAALRCLIEEHKRGW